MTTIIPTGLSKPKPKTSTVDQAATAAFIEGKPAKAEAATGTRVFFAPEGHRRLTINIPHEMHKKLSFLAVERDTTVTKILIDLIEKEVGR